MTIPVVIHGHFYQPPRENPWTGRIERQPSAEPDHDWNARVHRECYRPNAFARVFDDAGRIEAITNNYARMSFNFGPTLLSWMQAYRPEAYARVIEADRVSCGQHGGHGNGMAQSFHHSILPLCSPRDLRTQVRWGLADFRHRFGREAESMWLPETACNDATLACLIEEGLRWVILAPRQVAQIRPLEGGEWRAPKRLDTGHPYRWLHPDGTGRSIAVFFYDGELARAIAFGGALASSSILVDHLEKAAARTDGCIHVATDGESYGHHSRYGDLTLAYSLIAEAPRRGFQPMNYGEVLDRLPPVAEVRLAAGDEGLGSSWSCAHGVGRWFRDCGCHTGGEQGWSQAWRTPLRQALDFLRDAVAEVYEDAGGDLFEDPWAARDGYVEVVLETGRRRAFLETHARQGARSTSEPSRRRRALRLLELQRNAMLMYTSCGWFFNDLAGLETVQVLRYAGRVVDLIDELGMASLRESFLERLSEARANRQEDGSGADIFRRQVETARVSIERMAGHVALSGLFGVGPDESPRDSLRNFRVVDRDLWREERAGSALAAGKLVIEETLTETVLEVVFAALHRGDLEVMGAMRPVVAGEAWRGAVEAARRSFAEAPVETPYVIGSLFGPTEISADQLISEGDDAASRLAVAATVDRFRRAYAQLYESHRPLFDRLHAAGLPLPRELKLVVEATLARRFDALLVDYGEHGDPEVLARAVDLARIACDRGYDLPPSLAAWRFDAILDQSIDRLFAERRLDHAETILQLLAMFRELGADLDLRNAQERVYEGWQSVLGAAARDHASFRDLVLRLGFSPTVLDVPAERERSGTGSGS